AFQESSVRSPGLPEWLSRGSLIETRIQSLQTVFVQPLIHCFQERGVRFNEREVSSVWQRLVHSLRSDLIDRASPAVRKPVAVAVYPKNGHGQGGYERLDISGASHRASKIAEGGEAKRCCFNEAVRSNVWPVIKVER